MRELATQKNCLIIISRTILELYLFQTAVDSGNPIERFQEDCQDRLKWKYF